MVLTRTVLASDIELPELVEKLVGREVEDVVRARSEDLCDIEVGDSTKSREYGGGSPSSVDAARSATSNDFESSVVARPDDV